MRLIILYIFLVGLPFLAVLKVLQVGNDLKPPVFLGGRWKVERSSNASDDSRCGDLSISTPALLTVSQSGPHLLLKFNNESETTLAGEIDGAIVTAKMIPRSNNAVVNAAGSDESVIEMRATIDRRDESACLLGTLIFTNCLLGTEVSFIAVRQPDGTWKDQ